MNAYKHLTNKGKDITRNTTYASIITNSLVQMFEYSGEDIDSKQFETALVTHGSATLAKFENKYYPVILTGNGKILPDRTFEKYHLIWFNNMEMLQNDVPREKVAVCRNTSDSLPALNILRFADMLSEVDLSMVFNLQRSRLAPIPIAKNKAVRTQLSNILQAVKNGNYEVISADIEKDLITGKTNAVEMINLNDPKAIEYMNYLSELHDALTRRLYTMYGMAVQETSKHAQVNKDESNARDGVSWLIPDNMLYERKQFCERFNKLNGTNLSVDYSELFKAEREILNNRQEEKAYDSENLDDSANDSDSDSTIKSDSTN